MEAPMNRTTYFVSREWIWEGIAHGCTGLKWIFIFTTTVLFCLAAFSLMIHGAMVAKEAHSTIMKTAEDVHNFVNELRIATEQCVVTSSNESLTIVCPSVGGFPYHSHVFIKSPTALQLV